MAGRDSTGLLTIPAVAQEQGLRLFITEVRTSEFPVISLDLFAIDPENRIITEVKKSYDQYLQSLKRMQVASRAVIHEKKKWEGEIKKYDQGRSDPDLVIRYQNDYLNARKLLEQTRSEYQSTVTQLIYVRGKLLP